MSGINIGGLVAGAGDNLSGLNIGGLVVGAGSNVEGINVGGLAAGAGNRMSGLNIAGLAVGAPELNGLTVAPIAGGVRVSGLTIAPAYFRIPYQADELGVMKGVSVSTFNHIQGVQKGLSIGILNIARNLKGVQLGLINIAHSNRKGLKVLPFFNAPFR